MMGYQDAEPFPHAVIDGFLTPEEVFAVRAEFPTPDDPSWKRYDADREAGKLEGGDSLWGPATRQLAARLESAEHLRWLEELTGIEQLEARFWGGGYHMIRPGGRLDMHVDFNRLANLYRRLNFLVYLNPGWDESWGGHLLLSDPAGEVGRRIAPLAGRAVVFSTSETSFHGHPEPLACPEGQYRCSFACYYYSPVPAPGVDPEMAHSTAWLD